jgi:hypothetical protein
MWLVSSSVAQPSMTPQQPFFDFPGKWQQERNAEHSTFQIFHHLRNLAE